MRVEAGLEGGDIEPDLFRVARQLLAPERLLVGEEALLHLPELALRVGTERSFGRNLRILVEGQRLVLEDQAHLAFVEFLDLFEGRANLRAEGTLEVRVLDNRHQGVGGAMRRLFAVQFELPDRLVFGGLCGLRGSFGRRGGCRRWRRNLALDEPANRLVGQ